MRRTMVTLVLGALGGCASVPPVPDALPLDGPMTPLVGTVGPPPEAWGPFREICTVTAVESEPPLVRVRSGSTSCMRIETKPAPDGALEFTMYPSNETPARFAVQFRRSRDGSVADIKATGSLLERATPAQRDQLSAALREAAAGLTRIQERPPLQQGTTWTLQQQTLGGGFQGQPMAARCQVTGSGTIGGRPVVVASCDGNGSGRLFSPRGDTRFDGKIEFRTQVAIDAPTGVERAMLSRIRLAGTFLRIQDGGSSSGPLNIRSATRLD